MAQPDPRAAHADRLLWQLRAPGVAVPDRRRRLPRERALLPGEGRRAGDPRRPRARVLDQLDQQPGVDGPEPAGAGAGAPPDALCAVRRTGSRAVHPLRLPEPEHPDRDLGRELRRLPCGEHAFPTARPLRRNDRHVGLLRPRRGLFQGLQRRQLLLQQPGLVRAATRRGVAAPAADRVQDPYPHRSGRLRGTRSVEELRADPRRQRNPHASRALGQRRQPRLAVVAEDAALRDRRHGLVERRHAAPGAPMPIDQTPPVATPLVTWGIGLLALAVGSWVAWACGRAGEAAGSTRRSLIASVALALWMTCLWQLAARGVL